MSREILQKFIQKKYGKVVKHSQEQMFERPGKQQKRKQMKGVKSFVSSIVEYLFEKGKMKRHIKLKQILRQQVTVDVRQ